MAFRVLLGTLIHLQHEWRDQDCCAWLRKRALSIGVYKGFTAMVAVTFFISNWYRRTVLSSS